MGEDNGQTISMSQLFAETRECLRETRDERRALNQQLQEMERQLGKLWTEVTELRAELKQLRDAEEERKRLKRDVWATAMRVAVTAAAGGVVGWLVLGFKESVK